MPSQALIDTDWLQEHLGDPDLRLLDASWCLPSSGRKPRAEFEKAHIPGAQFFEIDAIADRTSTLPHMLPSPSEFALAVGALGIGNADRVVVYDTSGLYSAPRVWWTFRVFGHDRVSVLDGGFPKWQREGRPIETVVQAPAPKTFNPHFRSELVRTLGQMRQNLDQGPEQVLDARSRGRFKATEPEPRAGLRGGHIPGSKNLPFGKIVTAHGTLADIAELRVAFEQEIDLNRPIVTSCGSGLTATILALGLHELGRDDVAVYDGSWSEWGALSATPVEK